MTNQEKLMTVHVDEMDSMINVMNAMKNEDYDLAKEYHQKSVELSKLIAPLLTDKGAHHFREKTDEIIAAQQPKCTMDFIKTYIQCYAYDKAIACFEHRKTAGIEALDSLRSQDFEKEVDIMYHSDPSTLRAGSVVIIADEF